MLNFQNLVIFVMKPLKINHAQGRLFEARLSELLNPKHELYQLSQKIDWDYFEKEFEKLFKSNYGHPPKPIRLIVGLIMLQNIYNESDERVIEKWVENPYWQLFCGFDFLQWEPPINPTSLVHWRKRFGKEGLEKILKATIVTALKTKTIKKKSLTKTISDTTVMPKNITYPTDSKLYVAGCRVLVRKAKKLRVPLRQSFVKLSKIASIKAGKYAHARQMKRAAREQRRLKTYLGRLSRDIKRKIKGSSMHQKHFKEILALVDRLLKQEKIDKNKLYSLFEPHVECISKGKVHKKYEFGCKVSLVTTHKEGLVLCSEAIHGNPYDGHILKKSLAKAEQISNVQINQVFVDKGYRGHTVTEKEVFISGQRRGITQAIKKAIKRRQAIEPHIGHMKSEGKLSRNYLKGIIGDKSNAILCGIGHNLRMILRKLRIFFAQFFYWIKKALFFEEMFMDYFYLKI